MDFHDRDSLSKEIGRRLSKARNNAGFTQQDAAEQLTRRGFSNDKGEAIGYSLIANWEQGTRTARDLRMIMALAEFYRVSYAWILCAPDAPDAPKDQQERVLLGKYRGTDERGRKAIQGVADAQPVYPLDREGSDNNQAHGAN
jgi:transcriptional regulator with XRE-family HTH domain